MSYALIIAILNIVFALAVGGGVVWLAAITPDKSPHPSKEAE